MLNGTEDVTRRPYQKPEVSEIELIIDDAVLGGSTGPQSIDPIDELLSADF